MLVMGPMPIFSVGLRMKTTLCTSMTSSWPGRAV